MKYTHLLVLPVIAMISLISCGDPKSTSESVRDSLVLEFTVVNTLPHSVEAFTEGLEIHNGKILESTGQHNHSWIAEVNPGSGEHDKKINLDGQYFGEGITLLNNKIYQLTYKHNIGFIYDAKTYKKIGEFPFTTSTKEGWGMTHDDTNLIISDGSEHLYFLDSVTLKTVKTISVKENGSRLKQINELEFVNGYIFANVWQTNFIVKIDPSSGKVVGRLDLTALNNEIRAINPQANEMNGIAYDKNSKCLLVTGKFWPKAYLIKVK
ncbi:MAG TPA: glutaminyl-peptide cyclotransferase [Chryseolinea sp.]|nr:glutaminyl-peptide cyclotransferase [Chryseolinea sp.]HPH46451.1 glutaminyl-peptide cyclotransferase [Chryseolinea sp.]HPM30522.1 glutaminyl-peptide cyclotransferase [Chryseolinea sp.]